MKSRVRTRTHGSVGTRRLRPPLTRLSVVKMQALRNGVKSLRSDVSTPCWVETGEAVRIGAAEGISGRVIFADFSSRTPGKIYRKNSDSPLYYER